jgi:hypothetical protein
LPGSLTSLISLTLGAFAIGTEGFMIAGLLPALGGVDSKDSLLGANQIQGFFLGGGLGCDGSFGFERCGLGADGASDYRSA